MSDKIKVEVIKGFRDTKNGMVFQPKGKIIEIAEDRMEEINGAGFGNLVRKHIEESESEKDSKGSSKKDSKKSNKKK